MSEKAEVKKSTLDNGVAQAPAQSGPRRRFTTRLKEELIEIEDNDGTVQNFIVREIQGAKRDEYIDFLNEKKKFDKDGNPTVTGNNKGIAAKLISIHLWYEDGRPFQNVPLIDTWPSTTQVELVHLCNEISGLDKEAQKKSKND